MAYSKQTWTNDVSKVNADRMNHIELGIEAISNDVTSLNNKVNPSGTATTTSEIEEGQITDVIGFKSLKLKGQTSQYTTTGKNKFNVNGTITNRNNATAVITNDVLKQTNTGTYSRTEWQITGLTANTSYTLKCKYSNPNGASIQLRLLESDNSTAIAQSSVSTSTSGTLEVTGTISETSCYIRFYSNTLNETNNKVVEFSEIQLETGTSATNYEKYSGGKASPNPDFPSDVNNVSGDNVIRISNKNIFDKDDSNSIFSGFPNGATNKLQSNANAKTAFIPCKPSTKYTVSKTSSARFIVADTSSNSIVGDIDVTMLATATNVGSHTVTTSANAKYLLAFYYLSTADTKTEQEIRNSLQIEQSNSATTYTEHQGNNFELNFTKNLFDSEKYLENASISNNTIVSTNNNNLFYIPVQYGRNYTFSFVDNGVSGNILYGFSNDKPVIGGACTYNILDITQLNKHTFTPVSTNNKYLCIRLNVVNTNQYLAMENIQVEVGNQATEYIAYNENPIELCKIGTYQDYIYKKDGKWYKYKAIEKLILDGTEAWSITNTGTSNFYYQVAGLTTPKDQAILPKSNYFTGAVIINSNTDKGIYIIQTGTIRIRTVTEDTVTNFKTWLSTNTPSLYYVLATPIDEEITYTPLIRQLDELYNSGLYDNTNISQDNSSEAFILDLEACKNNINGIVEYIRR